MKLAVASVAAAGLLLSLSGCPNKDRRESLKASKAGSIAFGQKQFENAAQHYKKATDMWPDNHTAWYGLGGSFIQKGEWEKASEALGEAAKIKPEEAMYQMYLGIALYRREVKSARDELAKKEGRKPEEVEPDLSTRNFEKPKQFLQEAVKLNPDLWKAHYYLGSIYRDTGKPKEAAEAFNKSLESAPNDPGPWVALSELYRRWDYTDQAIQVAEQGVKTVPGDNERSDLFFVAGMGYEDKANHAKAIAMFDEALKSRRDNHKAKFQRGQAYFKSGELPKAKLDLEEFSKSGGGSVEFEKQQASRMLLDIAAKSATQNNTPPQEKLSPEDVVKKGKKG
ncbi:MAG: tetratricopeptide repeat protein [Kofleriaceae bacterium]